jgi:fructokinase
MNKKFKVIGIGEVLWDITPQGKVLGGAPANFTYHATKLGAEGNVISAVGKDDLGEEIIDNLTKYNLNKHIRTDGHPTSTVKISINDKGEPSFDIFKDVAWDYLRLTPEDITLVKQADAVCFGSLAQRNSISKNVILELIRNTPEKALKIFDVNLRQNYYSKEILEKSIQLSNIIKLNEEELRILSGIFGWEGDEHTICKQIIKIPGIKLLAYTCGADGSYLYTNEDFSFMKSPLVNVIDTVGAGDAFTAGLAMGMLNRKNLYTCHCLAVEISAYVCTYCGAMPVYSDSINKLVLKMMKDH